jgi:hypothetical protein
VSEKQVFLNGLRWSTNILNELFGNSGFLTKEERSVFLNSLSGLSNLERSIRFPVPQKALDELIRESEALGMYEPQDEV